MTIKEQHEQLAAQCKKEGKAAVIFIGLDDDQFLASMGGDRVVICNMVLNAMAHDRDFCVAVIGAVQEFETLNP